MNCPFCQTKLSVVGSKWRSNFEPLLQFFYCVEADCLDLGAFARYSINVTAEGDIIEQTYILDNFYVKVNSEVTRIWKKRYYDLTDEVKIPRAIWLNPINIEATLDKLKLMVIMS